MNRATELSTPGNQTPISEQGDLILGIDFGGTKVAVGLADPRTGALLATDRLDTNAADGAMQAVDRAMTSARSLLGKASGRARLLAVGVVSPGIVLPDRILLAPNVPGWGQLRLREEIARRIDDRSTADRARRAVPIAVGTDAKAAALAEWRWGTLAGADPAVFVSLGTGVGSAIIVGGTVLSGANGAAGEIGYNLRGVDDSGGHANGSASLEKAVGGRGLGARASALLGRPTTAAELFAIAEREGAERDEAARALLAEALDELAVHVANLAIAIDPAAIAVGGGFIRSAQRLLPALRRRLVQAVPFPPELVPARFEQDGALRGAVAIAMHALTQPSQAESIEANPVGNHQVNLRQVR